MGGVIISDTKGTGAALHFINKHVDLKLNEGSMLVFREKLDKTLCYTEAQRGLVSVLLTCSTRKLGRTPQAWTITTSLETRCIFMDYTLTV